MLAASLACVWILPVNAQEYNFAADTKEMRWRYQGEPASGLMALDAAVMRPLGLATTIAGTGLFVITLPFTAPSCNVQKAADGLIIRPGGWTFDRPLGRENSRWDEPPLF